MTTTTTSSSPAAAEKDPGTATIADKAARESARVMEKLREKKAAVKAAVADSLQPKIDAVSSYARNDPTKAVLIAAASGAALMGLLGLLVRVRRPATPGARAMTSIRDAALDLADRAHVAATDAIGAAHARASSVQQRAEDVQTRAGAAADRVTETWQSLREQAAPVIEKLRPQLDAVASYAKEDPVRAAFGVTAVAAVLFSLLSMAKR
jgi:ElaB/YqjD/DUF883 family membrane-anchored ribosome-binding protein